MIERRIWMASLLGIGGAMGSAALGIPAIIAALTPSLKGRAAPAWRTAGKIDDFPLGKITPVEIEVRRDDWSRSLQQKTVYVWRKDESQWVVYSRSCTDLSCPLTFDPGSECFFCPCHGGIFAKNGDPMAGPPKKPLYRYANRSRAGVLEIDLHSLPPFT